MRLGEILGGALGRLSARWNWTAAREVDGRGLWSSPVLDRLLLCPAIEVVANVVFRSWAASTLVVCINPRILFIVNSKISQGQGEQTITRNQEKRTDNGNKLLQLLCH